MNKTLKIKLDLLGYNYIGEVGDAVVGIKPHSIDSYEIAIIINNKIIIKQCNMSDFNTRHITIDMETCLYFIYSEDFVICNNTCYKIDYDKINLEKDCQDHKFINLGKLF